MNQIIPTGTTQRPPARGARGVGRRPDAGDQPELGAVEHQGQHVAPDLDARERHVRATPASTPTAATCRSARRRWPTRTSSTSRTTPAQSRINDGIQFDDTLAWFMPGKRGDHDIKVGAQYQLLGRLQHQPGQPERHVRVRPATTSTFNPADPSDLSGSVHDPRRRTEQLLREGALRLRRSCRTSGGLTPRLTLSLGLRYDLEIIPIAETDDPLVDELSGRQEQHPAALRRDLRPRRRHERRPRRLRPLLRQDALRADRRPLHRHAVHRRRSP